MFVAALVLLCVILWMFYSIFARVTSQESLDEMTLIEQDRLPDIELERIPFGSGKESEGPEWRSIPLR